VGTGKWKKLERERCFKSWWVGRVKRGEEGVGREGELAKRSRKYGSDGRNRQTNPLI